MNDPAKVRKMTAREVIREMRPYQRKAAELIIQDVCAGDPPNTISEALDRYQLRIGEGFLFDTGGDWKGDIRETAIWTLLKNGFAKGKQVTFREQDLTHWGTDKEALERAAKIEIDFGGNRARSMSSEQSLEHLVVRGTGDRCVYVYTDSRLDMFDDQCCKIGRHNMSGRGEVLGRILQQYRAANPGYPVLRYIFRTDNEVELETALHHKFRDRATGGIGREWFEVSFEEVLRAVERIRPEMTQEDRPEGG